MEFTLDSIASRLAEHSYISDEAIAMSLFLSAELGKPLLIEGPAGVGKTEIAKVLAQALETDLIRLQCYEGLDANHALYEWNYQHQLLHLRMLEARGFDKQDGKEVEKELFSDRFLLRRPVLEAISSPTPVVLLIDEIDRADEEFESFLLEVLSDWQVTIPETGTIEAKSRPHVILTGNRSRELSEALRRRCLYLWIGYPDFEKEYAILKTKAPDLDALIGEQICRFMQELRQMKLEKTPGIAETLDWAQALAALNLDHLDQKLVEDTLGVVLKDWQDIRTVTDSLTELLDKTGVVSKIG